MFAQTDTQDFRRALGTFVTGVTVVTSECEGEMVGITANSFNSVSLDPPLVLWSLSKQALSLPVFKKAGKFAVNILAETQSEISNRFSRRGEAKFEDLRIEAGKTGMPLLGGCCAHFECRTVYEYDGGDHVIFVGEVVAADANDASPLAFHRGRYARATVI